MKPFDSRYLTLSCRQRPYVNPIVVIMVVGREGHTGRLTKHGQLSKFGTLLETPRRMKIGISVYVLNFVSLHFVERVPVCRVVTIPTLSSRPPDRSF